MIVLKWRAAIALSLAIALGLAGRPQIAAAQTSSAAQRAAENEIIRIDNLADGIVGVSAIHLESGRRLDVHAEDNFPMASTYKVAIAATVLDRVDRGQLSLEKLVPIEPEKMVLSEVISDSFIHPGLSVSVANLMELMMTRSDNTATDILVELAGGPASVTRWLRAQGIKDQRVDRPTAELLRDYFRLPPGPFNEVFKQAKAKPGFEPNAYINRPHFNADGLDNSTPAAMTQLLERIFKGKALRPQSTSFLIAAMERCRTGEGRIKGRLPDQTKVAHKTGTIGGTANDVGFIEMPDGSHVAIAVMLKNSEVPLEERDRTIANIARTVFDYFLFAPTAASAGSDQRQAN